MYSAVSCYPSAVDENGLTSVNEYFTQNAYRTLCVMFGLKKKNKKNRIANGFK